MADEPYSDPEVAEAPAEPKEDEGIKGLFQQADDVIIKQLKQWLLEAADGHQERRRQRATEWAMLSGDQWEKGDETRMSNEGRARLTLNLLLTTMSAVEGEERANRQEIKFYGEEQGDDPTAHGWNQLLKWVMNQCGGEFALSRQFKCQSAVGEGWVVPEVDYFDDPEGMIKLSWVDEDEMFDDPLSVDPVARDSRFIHRAQMKFEDEMEARWPGKVKELKDHCAADGIGPETDGSGARDIYLTQGNVKTPKVYSATSKQWLTVETWWTQIQPGIVIVNDMGELEELLPEEFEERKAARLNEQKAFLMQAMSGTLQPQPTMDGMPSPAPQMPPPIQAQERPIRCFYQAFWVGDVLLEKRRCPIKNLRRYPYVPARSFFNKKEKEWDGLLKFLLDPQRQHNVEQTAIIQWIQRMPKSSWMGPKGSFHNKAEWQQKVAQPGQMLEYNAARGKPEQIETPPIPRHMIDLAMSRPQSVREISGVNIEMTGHRTGNDAGVVMEMRKKAAMTVLVPLFDNYRQSKIETGRVLLAYMQEYIPVGRRVRVMGDKGISYVQMTEDMKAGKFDLKVEEENASINDRIATLTVMQTTLPQMIKEGVPIPPEFVDLLPMPPHIRDALKRSVAWVQLVNGLTPPNDWQPGMPNPLLAPPMAPGEGAPPPGDAPAPPPMQ